MQQSPRLPTIFFSLCVYICVGVEENCYTVYVYKTLALNSWLMVNHLDDKGGQTVIVVAFLYMHLIHCNLPKHVST